MKRTPLKRSTPLARGTSQLKRTPLAPRSRKRKAETLLRQHVRDETLARAGHRCEAAAKVPEVTCWGPLDVDERVGRGAYPGAHLDLSITQVLCRAHHSWKHEHPWTAHDRGLTFWSWEYERARR